jgi:hypothetical protein
MKDLRPALRTYLLDDPAIAAVVDNRVFVSIIPQGETRASIVVSLISGRGDHHMEGASGLARPRLQIDAWAPDADVATALGNAVRDRIDGFSGVMGEGDAAVAVQGVFLADERDGYDDTTKLHRLGRDYFVNFDAA